MTNFCRELSLIGRALIGARPVGFQNKRIPNKAFSASTIYNRWHAAWLARLHNLPRGRWVGCWIPRHMNHRQWIQVDLRRFYKIVKVATQGRYNAKQYVTKFVVKYSLDRIRWLPYTKKGRVQVFPGNRDPNTVKENVFRPAMRTRYVRIHPKGWVNSIAMRLEFYGRAVCK